jgi:anti-sigma B factor antagonist
MANAPAKSLTLEIEQQEGKIVVHCHGRIVAGLTDILYSQVHPLIPGSKCIVLDLTDVTFVDSMGLGTIVRLYVGARSAGSRLELVNLGKQIRELLGITNLLTTLGGMAEQGVIMRF